MTNRNVENVKRYIVDTWDQVLAHYEEQVAAGGEYYRTLLQGAIQRRPWTSAGRGAAR
ncbi:MAG: hypothetical protein ACLR23_12215 [Clostridia bacterium]